MGREKKEFISYRMRAKRVYIAFVLQIYRVCKATYRICFANISLTESIGEIMEKKSIKELAIELAVNVTKLCDNVKAKAVYSNQLLRSCSSIGANAYEAKYAHSRADFISKMEIALKECYETDYWLELLYRIGTLSVEQYKSVSDKCGTIRRKLISSITTAKKNS